MLVMDDPKVALDQAIIKETINGIQVTTLPSDFYKVIIGYINNSTEKTKLMSQLETLKSKRKAKLLQIAAGTIPITNLEGKLTEEDIELFKTIRSALSQYDQKIIGMLNKPVVQQ